MLRNFFFVLVFFVLLSGLAIAEDAPLAVHEAHSLIQANKGNPQFVILDVRAQELLEQGHIEGARMINYYATNFARLVGQLDRNATILIYCQRGRQSPQAMRSMKKMGFSTLRVLDGGFGAWIDAGLPVEQ